MMTCLRLCANEVEREWIKLAVAYNKPIVMAKVKDILTAPNDRTERQPPRRDNARDARPPERVAEAHDSRTAKRGGCSLQ